MVKLNTYEYNIKNMNKLFDELRACTDPDYLETHQTEAADFADANLTVKNIYFIQALHIQGALGRKVDKALLVETLGDSEGVVSEVIFYLARVSIPEMDDTLAVLLNKELEGKELNTRKIYWLISALIKTGTTRAKLFLKGLLNNTALKGDPIINVALESAKTLMV